MTIPFGGRYQRVADPEWDDPLDATFAARDGQRWNPQGLPCLYLNGDVATARANVRRLFAGRPYGPEDLDPAAAPLLIEAEVPDGEGLDVATARGLQAVGLPETYPLDGDELVGHDRCQPIGQAAFDEGLDGIVARSAAPGGSQELAWFARGRRAEVVRGTSFIDWF